MNPWTGFPMPPFLDNDIAILELEEEVDLMEYTPICLAGTGVKESGNYIYVNLNMNLDPISNGSYLTEFVINVVCDQVSELLRAGARLVQIQHLFFVHHPSAISQTSSRKPP